MWTGWTNVDKSISSDKSTGYVEPHINTVDGINMDGANTEVP